MNNAMPELSRSQRKRLAAIAYNAMREQPATIPCSHCHKLITYKPAECERDGIYIIVPCPSCKCAMRLYRRVR